MTTGREIVEAAAQMSAADLSVLVTAVRNRSPDEVRLMTSAGSDNDRLWGLMAEKGWLTKEPPPEGLPMPIAVYGLARDKRQFVAAVAVVSFEGRRQGMSAEEILAFGRGQSDDRLNHLL